MQQNPGWNNYKVRFAESNEPFVVQQAQRKTGRCLRHRQDLGHAIFDSEGWGVVLSHQALENTVQQKGIDQVFPIGHEGTAGQ